MWITISKHRVITFRDYYKYRAKVIQIIYVIKPNTTRDKKRKIKGKNVIFLQTQVVNNSIEHKRFHDKCVLYILVIIDESITELI